MSDPVVPFPDNVAALNLFNYMRTQWRTGANGPSGLDYGVMHQRMDRMGLSPEAYDRLEADIVSMETAALRCIHAPR